VQSGIVEQAAQGAGTTAAVASDTPAPHPETWTRVVAKYTTRRPVNGAGIGEKFRIWFGLRPKKVSLTLAMSAECKSYHMEMKVPEGMYVYRSEHRLVGSAQPNTNLSVRQVPITAVQGDASPELRTNPIGLNVAHVYSRDISRVRLVGSS
jgi:hypothetical protein